MRRVAYQRNKNVLSSRPPKLAEAYISLSKFDLHSREPTAAASHQKTIVSVSEGTGLHKCRSPLIGGAGIQSPSQVI